MVSVVIGLLRVPRGRQGLEFHVGAAYRGRGRLCTQLVVRAGTDAAGAVGPRNTSFYGEGPSTVQGRKAK